MRATLLFALVVLFSGLRLPAQEGDPGVDLWRFPAENYPSTIQGCLQNSSLRYTVTDRKGEVYNLTGNTAKLSHLVGHSVEITGKPTVITLDTTVFHAASTVEMFPALEVKTAKQLAGTCQQPPHS
jgi:hypothetical protein